jgi:hypothetical protein
MKTEIVVARYNENLDWLKKIKKSKDLKITVYNKGKDDIDVPCIKLPNIGRESHTYLYHIINNYDKLADQTIFCQGDSIFHSPDFLDLINKYRKKFEPVQPLSAWYWPNGVKPKYEQLPAVTMTEQTKHLWLGKKARVHVEYMNNDFISVYPYFYMDTSIQKMIYGVKSLYNIENPLKFNVERFRLKDVDLNYLIPMCYAAIFSVNKEAILDNSVDYYNNMMSILIYDVRNILKNRKLDHGLFLERLWLVIFNYKKYNKNYLNLKVKDYTLEDKNLIVKNNTCNFSYFNIYCQLYFNLFIDDSIYNLHISKIIINLKKKNEYNPLYQIESKENSNIKNKLEDNKKYNVLINLNNNILIVKINNNILFEYNFDKINVKHNILKDVTVYDIAKYHKFKDNLLK